MSQLSWNQALSALPGRCDTLVIGAGPAGSACARVLAQAGREVMLIDAQPFPREKAWCPTATPLSGAWAFMTR
jgi:flavin-dependent dehydrogenase